MVTFAYMFYTVVYILIYTGFGYALVNREDFFVPQKLIHIPSANLNKNNGFLCLSIFFFAIEKKGAT